MLSKYSWYLREKNKYQRIQSKQKILKKILQREFLLLLLLFGFNAHHIVIRDLHHLDSQFTTQTHHMDHQTTKEQKKYIVVVVVVVNVMPIALSKSIPLFFIIKQNLFFTNINYLMILSGSHAHTQTIYILHTTKINF